jgi:hypothetical protein
MMWVILILLIITNVSLVVLHDKVSIIMAEIAIKKGGNSCNNQNMS